MKRVLLILDGTNHVEPALSHARELCEPGDKLTVLAVAERPEGQIIGSEPPRHAAIEPYTGSHYGSPVRTGPEPDIPIYELPEDTERRVAGELRDELDLRVGSMQRDGIEIWTQAIVREHPASAVAEYARAEGADRIAVHRDSFDRLRQLLSVDGDDVLDGNIAPVETLPG